MFHIFIHYIYFIYFYILYILYYVYTHIFIYFVYFIYLYILYILYIYISYILYFVYTCIFILHFLLPLVLLNIQYLRIRAAAAARTRDGDCAGHIVGHEKNWTSFAAAGEGITEVLEEERNSSQE